MLEIRDACIMDAVYSSDFRYVLTVRTPIGDYTFYYDDEFTLVRWRQVGKDLPSYTDLNLLPHVLYAQMRALDVRLAFKTEFQIKADMHQREASYFKRLLTTL